MKQYIGFKLNTNEFTLPILRVREIVNTPAITRLPQSPDYVEGIINLRGQIIPIIDLKELVGMGETVSREQTKTIVVTSGSRFFGILVDEITSVINIDDADIEPAETFMKTNLDRVEGVARFDDRMIILLDTNKLVDAEEMDLLAGIDEIAPPVEGESAPSKLEGGMPQQATIAHEATAPPAPSTQQPREELQPGAHLKKTSPAVEKPVGEVQKDAKELIAEKYSEDDVKSKYLQKLTELIEALAANDFENADSMIKEMLQYSEGSLYQRIGNVTRKLHNSLRDFKNALDPRIKQLADEEVPSAVDSLEFVIGKTEEAANKTMSIVEKHLTALDEIADHVQKIRSPKESAKYLKERQSALSKDLNEILLTQDFQDLTGQVIRRVIELVNSIEVELVGLITTFGIKAEEKVEKKVAEKIGQDDIDSLLKEFGF